MKINNLIIIFVFFLLTNCVQKSSKETITARLNVEGIKNIQTVGIRGNAKPLSWKNDIELKPIKKDTLYEATFSVITGYKFIETKFSINGQLELKEKANRKIIFSNNNNTTTYEAKFEVVE